MGIKIALDKWGREVAQVGVRFVECALRQAADIRDVDPVVGLQCKLRGQFKLAINRAPVSCKNKSVLSLNNLRGKGDQPISMAFKILGARSQVFGKLMLHLQVPGNCIGCKIANLLRTVDERKG